MDPNVPTALSPQAAAAAAVMAAMILAAAVTLAIGAAQWAAKPRHRVGAEFGAERAEVMEWSGRAGYVRAGGEIWRATADAPLAPGDRVRIARARGLTLEVLKASTEPADMAAPSE